MPSWSIENGKKYDPSLPPYMWMVLDSPGERVCFYVPQENAADRESGIRSGAIFIKEIPDEWWINPDILKVGSYTTNNGREWRPLTLADRV